MAEHIVHIDVSQLKPNEITAYVFKYLEENEVDTTGLTPDSVTATVMAYEEITGGASTSALKPSDIVGLIVKYAEAENRGWHKFTQRSSLF